MTDMMYQTAALGSGGDTEDNTTGDYASYSTNQMNTGNNIQPRQRFPGLYVGNLTWWTTDRDVIDAINSLGITDVQEVKFFENRNNGQSKGFCMVTFSSDASLPIVIEKLPQKELHGQSPIVTSYNRQNLNIFEAQTKPRPQINQATNGPSPHAAGIMGINSITGMHAPTNAQATGLAGVGGMPYAGLNATSAMGAFNQNPPGINPIGGVRPAFQNQPNFRMGIRGPRAMMRGTFAGNMNNGPIIQGGHRMRFMQPQNWNNSQGVGSSGSGGTLGGAGGAGSGGGGGYNPAARLGPQMSLDISNRLGAMGSKQLDDPEMMSGSGAQGYHSSHHHSSQSDYRDHRSDMRDYRDLRDDRDGRRLDERSARLDERSLRHDDRSSRSRDDRPLKSDDKLDRHRRDDRVPSRRDDDRSSRHRSGAVDEIRRDRDDRSSRRDEKSSSSRNKDSRSYRSDERPRSRSRSRSKDKSRDAGKEKRGTGERDSHRDRDRGRERDRRERR